MTDTEYQTEWMYLFNERLGMLCGAEQPTKEQVDIATAAADAIMAMCGGPGQQDFIPLQK